MSSLDHIPARREFKYLIERERLPSLRRALRPYCDLDRYAGPDGSYPLLSLYFDTPDLALYHANEREAPDRYKARIRTYPDVHSAPVIAEIKNRCGDVIRKSRTRLPADDWTRALRPGGGVDLDPFLARVHQHDLRPVALVEYRREAWMSRIDEYARVSVDSAVRCQPARGLSLRPDPRRWRAVDHPLRTWSQRSICVVELKWADYAPRWMVQLVQHLDLIRHAFSKYCYSMLSLAEDHFMDRREAQSGWI